MQQTVVQQKVAELTAMNQLPPLSNLPQWARVNTLDKARYPRPFEKDKQAYLNSRMSVGEPANGVVQSVREGGTKADNEAEATMEDPYRRIQHLERSLAFLKQQHCEFLHCLHEEIDQLKRENKDLNFRIVMAQQKSEANSPSLKEENSNGEESAVHTEEEELVPSDLMSGRPGNEQTCLGHLEQEDLIMPESKLEKELSSLSMKSKSITNASTKTPSQDDKLEELRIIFLEEEVRKLRHAYQELRKRNAYLSQILEQSEGRRRRQMSAIESLRYQLNQCGVKYSMEPSLPPPPPTVQSYALANDLMPRQRTIPELEAFIKHLQQVNEKQAHELETLKSDLRDVLYSHKWTPDAYLLAKAYIVEDDAKAPAKDANKYGKIQLKQNTRKLRDIGYVADSITLPPLKQTVGNRAVERRKRTQILQKERLRRSEVL